MSIVSRDKTSSDPAYQARIPVTVIGGYLGAGKTTLINRMLRDNAGQRLAVLVNDFGAVNVDADLIAAHDGETISLTNGCVCCSIAGDLSGALASATTLRPRPDRIVIEASGVADPGRVVNYARGHPAMGIDGVIVLADSETVVSRSHDRFVGTTVRRQIASADLLVMTKADLTTTVEFENTRAWLRQTATHAPIVNSHECEIAQLLIALPQKEPPLRPATTEPKESGGPDDHIAQSIACPDVVDRQRVTEALSTLASDVLRCKGWLRFADAPGQIELVQGVGTRLEFSDAHGVRDDQHLCLVVICRNDACAAHRIKRVLRTAMAGGSASPGSV